MLSVRDIRTDSMKTTLDMDWMIISLLNTSVSSFNQNFLTKSPSIVEGPSSYT